MRSRLEISRDGLRRRKQNPHLGLHDFNRFDQTLYVYGSESSGVEH